MVDVLRMAPGSSYRASRFGRMARSNGQWRMPPSLIPSHHPGPNYDIIASGLGLGIAGGAVNRRPPVPMPQPRALAKPPVVTGALSSLGHLHEGSTQLRHHPGTHHPRTRKELVANVARRRLLRRGAKCTKGDIPHHENLAIITVGLTNLPRVVEAVVLRHVENIVEPAALCIDVAVGQLPHGIEPDRVPVENSGCAQPRHVKQWMNGAELNSEVQVVARVP